MTIKSSNGIFGAGSTGTARISPALISVMNSSTSEEISISPALQMVLDRMRALPTYNPVGSVFTSPKRQNCYTKARGSPSEHSSQSSIASTEPSGA